MGERQVGTLESGKEKERKTILTICCRIWQRNVVEQEEGGVLMGLVKGKWA